MRSSTLSTLLAVGLVGLGCHSTSPAPPLPYAARPVAEVALWQVWQGPTSLGFVRQLEIRDPQGPLPFYRIEDLHGRWLGHATQQLRFSRRVPFQDQEEDLGVWSMARGVQKLFETDASLELRPVEADAADANARRDR